MIPIWEVAMPRDFAKSGPSGMTIMKSKMLTNCIAPTKNIMSRSESAGAVELESMTVASRWGIAAASGADISAKSAKEG